MKVKQVDMGGGQKAAWRHWCPGCKSNHVIYTDTRSQMNGHAWAFNDNLDLPTFSPSINIVGQCHYFIKDGQIQYCGDSKHNLAGQTVLLPELESIGDDWWTR